MNRTQERGSSRLLAFISAMLFAALAFVLVSPDEKNRRARELGKGDMELVASRIVQFAIMTETALLRMRTTQRIPVEEISFENPFAQGYDNPSCFGDSCKIFHPAGGGVSWHSPDSEWLDPFHGFHDDFGAWVFPADVCVEGVPSATLFPCHEKGQDHADLLVMLPFLKREVCQEINHAIGLPMEDGNPPVIPGCGYGQKFRGQFMDGHILTDTRNVSVP